MLFMGARIFCCTSGNLSPSSMYWRLLARLTRSSGMIAVLMIWICGKRTRWREPISSYIDRARDVAHPDAVRRHRGGVLLKDLVAGNDLAVGLLHLGEHRHEVPELGARTHRVR